MPTPNLEALIADESEHIADQMNQIAQWAQSEEDVRYECNKLIDGFLNRAGLEIKGNHEYGLAGGRIDSKYAGVIIEYKDPHGSGQITEDRQAPGTKAAIQQLRKRFEDFQSEADVPMEKLFGVGTDGDTMVFVRHRSGSLEVQDPKPTTKHTVERLLRAIVSLGAQGKSFTPDHLTTDFSSASPIAQKGVRQLYDAIRETENPKVRTFFNQWKILFGEVCGYDVEGQNAKIRKLAEHYEVPDDPQPAELLFAVHSYYAVFIKFLAAEIVSSFNPLGTSTLKKCANAHSSDALKREMEALEQGGIWNQLGITNFLEGDLFSWYLDAWNEHIAEVIWDIVKRLDDYDPATLSVAPEESQDLLKQLYQQLFPKSVRHDLGEYYTPDWLAELVLEELEYDGNPDKRLLDPACGSGTFLVTAINRIKAWFEEHRHECGYGEAELVQKILSNVVGFDLNPLAVMASRTNYLLAIRDLLRHAHSVELPVYLCDSIMTPSEHGDLFTGGQLGTAQQLKTSAGEFHIPAEVTRSRDYIGRYADMLEFCIRNRYSAEEFLERCQSEGVPVSEEKLHTSLYGQLQDLDAENKNGVWARIIKNAFAPLFVGKADYIAGNPPWVNWENLPNDYRDKMKPLWNEYGLFTLKGHAARLGGGKKDLAIIFTYSAVDNYLNDGGRLGFVITQSIFKTQGAGDGFRQLHFKRNGKTVYLKPLDVKDLSAIQVFEGATNRTAVFVCEKGQESFSYPVPYTTWRGPARIGQDVSLDEARALVSQTWMRAAPVTPSKSTSPWLTAPQEALPGIQKVIGQSDYKAYEGVNTGGLNGVYWIRVLEERPNGDLLIENLHDVGKIKVEHVETVIEPDLVYPLLRGRDVQRWHAEPSAHIILAQDPETRAGIPEDEMKRHWPKTFAYLKQFEGDPENPQRGTLRGRSGYKKYYKSSDPFYSMYNVGPYTMDPIKVYWRQFLPQIRMCLCLPVTDPVLGDRVPLTQHVVTICPLESTEAAFFFSACGNSSPATLLHYVSSTGKSFGQPSILNRIRIPTFSEKDDTHSQLSKLSRECHEAAEQNATNRIAKLEAEIDDTVAHLWGITDSELRAIQDALMEMT